MKFTFGMSFWILFSLIVCVANNRHNFAQQHAVPNEALEQFLKKMQETTNSQSISAAVFLNDDIIWSRGINRQTDSLVPNDGSQSYRIGSVSKLFTAAVAVKLQEQKLLTLDDAVKLHLPQFTQGGDRLTLRMLGNHTGGVRHYGFREERDSPKHYTNSTDALELFKDDQLLFEPGQSYFYSSYAYTLLAAACEKVSGKTYQQLLENHLANPLKLPSVEVETIDAFKPQYAELYDGNRKVTPKDLSYKWAAGGLRANVIDLCKFGSTLFDSSDFFADQSKSEFFSIGQLVDGTPVRHSFGWEVDQLNTGEMVYFHDGEVQGGHVHLLSIPKLNIAVAIAVNRGSNFGIEQGLEFVKIALDLDETPIPKKTKARNDNIRKIVMAFDKNYNQFRNGLLQADLESIKPVVASSFKSLDWKNKDQFLKHLESAFAEGDIAQEETRVELSISGVDHGDQTIVSNLRIPKLFDNKVLFVFMLFEDEWLLSEIVADEN